MCPLVVESSISSSPLLLAVNDRQSQSHQLDSTSSTGNGAPLSLTTRHHTHMDTPQVRHTQVWETVRPNLISDVAGN